MRLKATLLLAALVLASCGGDEEPSPAPEDGDPGPLVTYQRSGGVGGVVEELRIEPDGHAVLSVGVDGDQSSFDLGATDLKRLRAELEAVDYDAVDAPGEPACADCFVYTIGYGGRTIEINDLDERSVPLATVLAHLGELVADNYPSKASGAKAGG